MKHARMAALAALAIGLGACGQPTDYNDSIRSNFMTTCIEGAGGIDIAEKICGCTYDSLEKEVPFEEFMEIDSAMTAGTATAEQQERLTTITLACVQEVM